MNQTHTLSNQTGLNSLLKRVWAALFQEVFTVTVHSRFNETVRCRFRILERYQKSCANKTWKQIWQPLSTLLFWYPILRISLAESGAGQMRFCWNDQLEWSAKLCFSDCFCPRHSVGFLWRERNEIEERRTKLSPSHTESTPTAATALTAIYLLYAPAPMS